MPFKNISNPKKLVTLEGPVKAAAYLKTPGLIAFASSDVGQLFVASPSGTSPRVSKLGLTEVEDLALLSRDVAVARQGMETWALLGIGHTAKMDRIVDDARQLAWRGAGQTALVLGWAGNASELSLKGNEVIVRAFSLRSDLRTAWIGSEGETYVLSDGGQGEFRIHPGATPEPGAITKASLDGAGVNLDRLSGGKFFSAAWRPNAHDVITFSRAGNRVEVKNLRMDQPATAVAVAETCLLVGTADGRVLLFDDTAIAEASNHSIEAKHSVDVGGQPNVILVVNNQIFIGTATGDIKTSTLARGDVAV